MMKVFGFLVFAPLLVAALSLVVFAWPVSIARRRHDELRYVDMGKEPTGYH